MATTDIPTWGDAADLIDVLDVRAEAEGRYVSAPRGNTVHRDVVEGSQMLAQSIVACGREAPGRRVVSAHMVFARAASALEPLELQVDQLASGRTFTATAVRAVQRGRVCAAGTFLLDVTADDVIRHAASAPAPAGPSEAVPVDMGVTGREIRVVDGAYTADPDAPVGPPVIDAWVRFGEVPSDPVLHAALLAQFTGHMSIATALRPHAGIGQAAAHQTLSTAINAIAISFHADPAADRWMRYHHESTFAGDGMTHSECRVYDEPGTLLASFTVDAMVRGFRDSAPRDTRTAL